ncbi:MAG: twitching motility protein PilT [Verrucomicrobiota bacterium JB022]|nr:twitching motility protein PilT [Verrucomicrobiota bacterium JB022]
MRETIRTIRIFFLLLCITAAVLVTVAVPEWEGLWLRAVAIGGGLGALVVLVDIMLKGFSLRGLSALTFGLFIGWVMATLISSSPFFDIPYESLSSPLRQNMYLIRLGLFVVLMYLGAVLALRGRDEFNLVIPYVRFVPHQVDVPLAVVDTSALIDSRIAGICESKFMGYGLVIPRFVIDELHRVADSSDPVRQAKGRRGLETLRRLRDLPHLDLRINESEVENRQNVDAKLIFLAQSLKARIVTTDFNLAQIAEFHNVEWLNLNALGKALVPRPVVGERFEIKLVKPGKESDQAVGYMSDGSMVVVSHARSLIGQEIAVEVQSVVPSNAGVILFADKV